MSGKLQFLGIITARGGSKGIPNKNIKNLAGKPLLKYTFDSVKNSKLLDRCILSSDNNEIINLAKKNNIEVPFKRPEELAQDDSSSLDVIIHAADYLKSNESYIPDFIVTLQPTSPLRTGEDIDEAIRLISGDEEVDSLVSVIEVPHNFTPFSIMDFDGKYVNPHIKDKLVMRRQDKPQFYARNGAAIYITKYNLLINQKRIIGDKCLPYFMPKERSIDIDDMYDWKVAELLIRSNE